MDKIKKFLKKLSKKELKAVLKVVEKIESRNWHGLQIKKLVGHQHIFRVRVGNIRILLLRTGDDYTIISIEKRSETTYDL